MTSKWLDDNGNLVTSDKLREDILKLAREGRKDEKQRSLKSKILKLLRREK